ncbi:MAG: hypothetical protein K9M51_02900 [Candidatus Gracilibacteria bacterium]|nr:hypothetical protein [Candidatus Gracilibacteria bacterium]
MEAQKIWIVPSKDNDAALEESVKDSFQTVLSRVRQILGIRPDQERSADWYFRNGRDQFKKVGRNKNLYPKKFELSVRELSEETLHQIQERVGRFGFQISFCEPPDDE